MRATKKEQDGYKGEFRGKPYPIIDDKAGYFIELWKQNTPEEVVKKVLSDDNLWGADLTQLNGFETAVRENLDSLLNKGASATLASGTKKTVV